MTVLTPGAQMCCKCLTPRRSTVVVPMSWDGESYELPLCSDHEQDADLAMYAWCNVAVRVAASSSEDDDTAGKKAAAPIPFPVIDRKHIVINRDGQSNTARTGPTLSALRREQDNKLIWLGQEYRLSRHAEERMQERDIPFPTVRQVLASRNKVTRPGNQEGTTQHRSENGKVVIVTSERDRVIVTVARNQAEADSDLGASEGATHVRKRA